LRRRGADLGVLGEIGLAHSIRLPVDHLEQGWEAAAELKAQAAAVADVEDPIDLLPQVSMVPKLGILNPESYGFGHDGAAHYCPERQRQDA
jgi:hypothetical protein